MRKNNAAFFCRRLLSTCKDSSRRFRGSRWVWMVGRKGHPADHGTTCKHFHCGVVDPPCTCLPRKRAVLVDQCPAANSYGYCPMSRYHRHREKWASSSAIESHGQIADGRLSAGTALMSAILVVCERDCASRFLIWEYVQILINFLLIQR